MDKVTLCGSLSPVQSITGEVITPNYTPAIIKYIGDYNLVGTGEITVPDITKTGIFDVGYIGLKDGTWNSGKTLYIKIRDKAGKTPGHFYGSDTWISNNAAANEVTAQASLSTVAGFVMAYSPNGNFTLYAATSVQGVMPVSFGSDDRLTIKYRFNATISRSIGGTYLVEVYTLEMPGGGTPFE